MSAPRRPALGTLALVLAAAIGLGSCAPEGSSPTGGDVGAGYEAGDGSFTTWEPAERAGAVDLAATTYDGTDVALDELRGEVVVVNFWYAACPPCRAEAPDLAALATDYADEGVTVLGVNPRDDVATAQAFERTFSVPYESIHDVGARAVAAFEGLVPLQAMPTTVVLDREGRVAARILGQADPAVLRGLVEDTLSEGA